MVKESETKKKLPEPEKPIQAWFTESEMAQIQEKARLNGRSMKMELRMTMLESLKEEVSV